MGFKNVYNALHTVLDDDSTLSYVSQVFKGWKESIPQQSHIIILEPGPEDEMDAKASGRPGNIKEVVYHIEIFARVILMTGIEDAIVGTATKKGVLDFVDDIKSAIRSNWSLSYNRQGSSVSSANVSGTFALDASNSDISVAINGRTPSGYDAITCGSASLPGATVASNIQTALRALGNHADDGYFDATCTFNGATNVFTITSQKYGPYSRVVVSAGASNDCSAIVGYDDPTELIGRNVFKIAFGSVTVDNEAFPVRYRTIPVRVTEEILIS